MNMYSDSFFMQQALKEAVKAFEAEEVPVGAVLVIQNKVVARAYNQVELLKDPTAHAEVLVITSACNHLGTKYLPEATLYVTVEPCLMCSGAIYWSKIGKVVYGAADIKNGYRRFVDDAIAQTDTPFHPKCIIEGGVLGDECAALMVEFFRNKRK